MYSTDHPEYERKGGERVDEFTLNGFSEGRFENLGEIHFCSEAHLRDLYERGYEIEHLEHKTRTQVYPETGDEKAAWDVVARKV